LKIRVIIFFFGALVLPFLTQAKHTLYFNFYSKQLTIETDSSLYVKLSQELSEQNIATFYAKLQASAYEPVINQLTRIKIQYNLNDWFYYQLVRKVAETISPKAEHYEQYTLYKWFLMGKSGYDVKLSANTAHLLFYIRSNENIYDIPYFTQNGNQYVCLNYHDFGNIDFKAHPVYEVNVNIPEGKQAFTYKVTQIPDFSPETYTSKELQFEYKQQLYTFQVKVNPQVQNIFQNYPVVDFDTYFNIPVSQATYASLIPSLREQAQQLTEEEGVDYLMHFSRYAFGFETDQQQFGKEKRLSPEQTLLYSKSDCDDRASLFFYLVKEIYNRPMLVLLYPTHVTIAVQFDNPVGKPIVYKGKKYYICEPTPQAGDLRIGQVSPQLRHASYQVVYSYSPGE
jgi:hypothetical protein